MMLRPSIPMHTTRRRLLIGGAGLVFAPSLIAGQFGAPAHAAGSRNLGPQLRLQHAGTWKFDNETYKFKFSPDGNVVALTSRREIHVMEFPTGRTVTRISAPRIRDGEVFAFGFEGRTIITLRQPGARNGPQHDEMIQIFDAANGRLIDRIAPPPLDATVAKWPINAVTSPDGRFLVVNLNELSTAPLHLQKESALVLLDSHDFSVRSILRESAPRRSFGIHAGRMALSNNLSLAVEESEATRRRANAPNLIAIYDLRNGERIDAFPGTSQGAATVNWSPDGTLLAVGSQPLEPPGTPPKPDSMEVRYPETVRDAAWIWNALERRTILSLAKVHSPVMSADVSPDNQWLAIQRTKYSGARGSGVSIFRIADGEEVFTYETPDYWIINQISFSPSGAYLVFTEAREFKIFRVVT